jgi:prefoldin beta subunit
MDQKEIMEFNQYSNQLNMLNAQIMNIKGMIEKVNENIDELNKSKETSGYKNMGLILVKKPKVELIKELEDNKKSLELRIKTLETQEKIVSAKVKEIKAKFEAEQKKEEKKAPEKKDKK